MKTKRISIRFCGGCNSRIDRDQIAAEVKKYLSGNGYEIVYNSLDADFIIDLSGCLVNCVSRNGESGITGVEVAANTIDAIEVSKEQLGRLVSGKVRDYFE